MRRALAALLLSSSFLAPSALAEDPLNFDIEKLCAWQNANNGMDVKECAALENEAKNATAALEEKADAERKTTCIEEARNYSGDSGYASHTVYAACLKSGPGNL